MLEDLTVTWLSLEVLFLQKIFPDLESDKSTVRPYEMKVMRKKHKNKADSVATINESCCNCKITQDS